MYRPAMEHANVWVTYTTNDDGHPRAIVGVFRSKEMAEAAAVGKGAWGGNGLVRENPALIDTNGSVYLLADDGKPKQFGDEEAAKELREKAMAKLSPAERKALGL